MLTLASASGNAFAYLWERDVPEGFQGHRAAQSLCSRSTGLGLDGLFLLGDWRPGHPWRLEHWDPDGGRTFCSNGTRAAAALLGISVAEPFEACSSGEQVWLRCSPEGVGLRLPQGAGYGLGPVSDGLWAAPAIFGWTGTPHLVLEVADVAALDLPQVAPPLRYHPTLPQGANVTFLQRTGPREARIRSWERGVEGETLCCGQGASVAGAWLTQRHGGGRWTLLPQGPDPVWVDAELQGDGAWRNLWLSGPVRVLGILEPGRDLHFE